MRIGETHDEGDLVIQAGDDRPFAWPVFAQGGEPLDFAGWDARAQVLDDTGGLLHEWSIDNGRAALGAGTVTLAVSDSAHWLWRTGSFELELTDPDGQPWVLAWWPVVVIPTAAALTAS